MVPKQIVLLLASFTILVKQCHGTDVIEQDACDAPLPEKNEDGLIDIGHGLPQRADTDATRRNLQETRSYMAKIASDGSMNPELVPECQNQDEQCSFWASTGECEKNPLYMKVNCAPACKTCSFIDVEARCAFDDSIRENRTWQVEGLNNMFTDIIDKNPDAQVLSEDPYVVVIDDFLNEEDCQHLIDAGTARGYKPSTSVGEKKKDGSYASLNTNTRTSSNTWCLEECYNHEATKTVIEKLEALTGVPDSHQEYLQLLHYDVGQYYHSHHDYIDFHNQRPMGVRILTAFLYLNDVEGGGGTLFNKLNITVEAKRGRVLLWPSVLNDAPDTKDERTYHEALPVLQGTKYGANAWMHQRSFKEAYERSCT